MDAGVTLSDGGTRRRFLKRAGTAALGIAALGAGTLGVGLPRVAFAADPGKPPPKPENVISPDAALERLIQGNARYVKGVTKRHDFKAQREALVGGQNPYAAILSCADSRIAPEYAFDAARGDLFVVRVAGNFANDDVIASLEYGVAMLNVPLIMVLGHGSCGAVDATISSVEGHTELPGHLPSLAKAIAPAVKAAIPEAGSLLDNAIRENVLLNVRTLSTASPILNKAVDDKKVRVVGGIYNLATGKVDLV
jgi:carbonic anhydrase